MPCSCLRACFFRVDSAGSERSALRAGCVVKTFSLEGGGVSKISENTPASQGKGAEGEEVILLEVFMIVLMKSRFPVGQVVITRNALEQLHPGDIEASLRRHIAGDWGECCPEDVAENELSLREGFRLLSVYRDRNGEKFWIITEADRSSTCVLLPEDY